MSETISKRRKIAYHSISAALLVVTLLFSVFRFTPVFLRTLQAARDAVLSVVYYVFEIFGGPTIPTTVQDIPAGMTQIMPITPDEFVEKFEKFCALLVDGDTWMEYLALVRDVLYDVALTLYRLSLPMLIIGLIVYPVYDSVEPVDDDGEPEKEATLPLKIWWCIELRIIYPVVYEIRAYVEWLVARPYWTALKWLWLYNLNVLTIAGEAIAYVFYVAMSQDFANIFVQAAKLLMDASIALDFLPWWGTALIAFKIFDNWRREQGFKKLESDEDRNQAYLEEHPENFVNTGRPRCGKTWMSEDMQQSQEVIFRRKAKEKAFQHKMWFPSFPWARLERTIRKMRETVPTFNMEFIHIFLKDLKRQFDGRAVLYRPLEAFGCKGFYKNKGYVGSDFIFDYDYKTYGMKYDNGLKIVELWECLELVAKEYYIYTAPTSIKVTNFPVRDMITWLDLGHSPQMIVDFFRGPSVDPKKATYSHIAIMDAFRLGKKKDEENPWKDSFEYGVLGLSEFGKEVGNQNTNTGKKADSEECNVRNDLFVLNAKMQGQGCTVDYYTYFRIFTDEQRAASIMADFRELGSELCIIDKTDDRIVMPGYLLGETLYLVTSNAMKSMDDFFSVRRSSQNLFYYLATKVYSWIFNHHLRIENTYSTHDVIFNKVDHAAGEIHEGRKQRWHLSRKKGAEAYATDFFGTMYEEKRKHSKTGGINQMPRFKGLKPTVEEMAMMGSHFFDSLDVMFDRTGKKGK